MYLSQLHLNRRNRGVLRDLAAPDEMHKTLWRAFPDQSAGGSGRVLFRVEPPDPLAGNDAVVLVQSEKPPDWQALGDGYLSAQRVTKVNFSPEANGAPDAVRLNRGDRFQFRLVANPTKKVDGQRHGLYREEDQRAWIERKAEAGGFLIVPNSLLVVPLGTLGSGKTHQPRRCWFAVRYEGGLTVTDPNALAATLISGIGSGKAFGFGLLSIKRP